MKKHAYNFEGGDVLNKMGASWFVSYTYHLRKDKKHNNWRSASGLKTRISHFMPSTLYHRFWLCKVLSMRKLDDNRIGLSANDLKKMALELLDMFW